MITGSSSPAYLPSPPAADTDAAQAKKARSQAPERQAASGRESKASKESKRSRPVADVFADLGDLPGMEGVHADIPMSTLVHVVPVAWPREVFFSDFPETRDGKWHLAPHSSLLTPPTRELDALRRTLAARCVQVGATKRKREEGDTQAGGTPMTARDFLGLAGPGSTNLGAIVSAMGHQLVQDVDPPEAMALGRDLARQLGGPMISTVDLKAVVGALMTVALHVSQDRPPPEGEAAAPPQRQPLYLLAMMLRAACHAMSSRRDEFAPAVSIVLRDYACRLGLAPVHAADSQRPTPQDYAWCRAPLQVLASVLDGRKMAPRALRWMLVGALQHLLPPDLPQDPRTQQVRAHHAQALLASLGWLLGSGEPQHLHLAAITALTREVARTQVDPRALGIGLAQAFGAARCDELDVAFLESVFSGDSPFTPRLGALAWGYLSVPASHAGAQPTPFEALLRLAPALKTTALGLAAHYMALAGAQAGLWQPAPPKGSGGLIGTALAICKDLDAARQIALVCGVKRAVIRMRAAPGFLDAASRMDGAARLLHGKDSSTGQAIELGLALADRGRVALSLDKTSLPPDEWAQLLLVALFASDQGSVSLMQDATQSLLDARHTRGRSLWAMGIMLERGGEIIGLPLMSPIRAFLVECLQLSLAKAGGDTKSSTERAAARSDTALSACRYLQILYRVMRTRLVADPARPAMVASEVAALEALQASDLPERARELLAPVVADLRQLLT